MADWYVSSATYALVAVWQATHAYVIGDLIKPTAPANGSKYVFRCTTAGTSGGTEPNWAGAPSNNATIVSGGATFTNVSGQSTYGWAAAFGDVFTASSSAGGRVLNGDRVFVSSDHTETSTANGNISISVSFNYGGVVLISVNRAGSVPPVAADIQNGAAISYTGASTLFFDATADHFWQGFTFTLGGSASFLYFNSGQSKLHYFKNCAFVFTTSATTAKLSTNNPARIILDNTTIQFNNVSQCISANYAFEITWINTPSALPGSAPTTLFQIASGALLVTCRGVDLSAVTGTLVSNSAGAGNIKVLLDSCRVASGVTRFATPTSGGNAHDEVELVNCYDGTNVISERYTAAGSIITDRASYLSGGAQDDVGAYSFKLASSTRCDFAAFPVECFTFDVENTLVGSARAASVEIISSGSLNNNDITLLLQYMGTSGSPIANFAQSLASVLTAAASLPASANTWISPPATPVKQLLQVSFTPTAAGRVRGVVRLGKVSANVWVNPQMTIT